jgi:thioesterase domain-containing protein
MKLVPAEMTLVEFRKLFDIFKIYANTTRRYKPGTYEGRISLFLPADDFASIFNADYDNAYKKSTETKVTPVEGWGRLATGGVDVHQIPGDHFSILHEPNVKVLGEQLRGCIEEARARRNGLSQ